MLPHEIYPSCNQRTRPASLPETYAFVTGDTSMREWFAAYLELNKEYNTSIYKVISLIVKH